MKDITDLQNKVINKAKIQELIASQDTSTLSQLLGVGASQVGNLRNGIRAPSTSGLLRLMLYYGVKPKDLVMDDPALPPRNN